MKRKRRKRSASPTIAVVMVLGLIIMFAVIASSTGLLSRDKTQDDDTATLSTTQSRFPSNTSPVSSSAQPSVSSVSSPNLSIVPAPSSTVSSQASGTSKGIYAGVKWRSSVAQPTDVSKHGRTLMLLNNNYELPEDFKWDLVLWKDGSPVDAMSLNSQKYDGVHAVDASAYQPLKNMFAAAKRDGAPLEMVSPYRSINLQDRLFDRSVTKYINAGYSRQAAIKKANTSRTFAGTSEHNCGFGFDLLEKGNWTLTESFDKTKQFQWLSEHAEEYGFILRYPADKTDITGIMYEPWHYRYVGTEHAKRINELGFCLEEYIEYLDNL